MSFGVLFESALAEAASPPGAPPRLAQAMQTALEGGKRFRPHLVARSCSYFGASEQAALRLGVAIEMLHCASLVLDDLPAMDDDEHRRNRPSIHKEFGEAEAILAGISLIARAFEVLADEAVTIDPKIRTRLVSRCAAVIGAGGMSGGQYLDITGGDNAMSKTTDLIAFCCEAGPILSGADAEASHAMAAFGTYLGRMFQQRDDALDGDTSAGAAQEDDLAQAKAIALGLEGRLGQTASVELLALAEWALHRPG